MNLQILITKVVSKTNMSKNMSMEEIWKKRNRVGERGKERREEGIRRNVGGKWSQ